MREIDQTFYKQNEDLAQYATAVVLSHDCRTGELIFASAGHPPTCGYHASQKEWGWLHERTTDSVETFEGLPLGLVPEAVFDRYNIVSENDLMNAGRKLEAYLQEVGDNSGTVVHQNAAGDSVVN